MDFKISLLISLIFVHMLADFVLQPNAWVQSKNQRGAMSIYLYLHSFLVAILSSAVAYSFFGLDSSLFVFKIIFISHLVIDLVKVYFDSFSAFLMDQFAHILVIIGVFSLLASQKPNYAPLPFELSPTDPTITCIFVIVIGYIMLYRPSGIFISKLTADWKLDSNDEESLKNAGKYIGYLERFLVFTFILFNQFTIVGFLITSKSILRIKGSRKIGEYILFGTLLSFTIAVMIGILVNTFLACYLPEELKTFFVI